MKRKFCKLMFALVAGLALAGCAELDMEGRGRVVLPPVVGPGQTVYEPRHADDQDDEGDKEKHKHKHKKKEKKEKDEGDDDDDDDGDDRHHGKHHKD